MEPPNFRDFAVDDIKLIVTEAGTLTGMPDERLETMRNKYPEFWFRYPKLLETACQGKMDLGQLEFMLDMLKTVTSKERTLECANKEVQNRLAVAYLPKDLMDGRATEQ